MMNPRYPRMRKRKNNDLCGKNFLKFVIYMFTFLFLLSGIVFLTTGLYIRLEKFTYVGLLGSSAFPVATYLLIATGGFILLSGILGCTGACVENRCCLVMYAVFLLTHPSNIQYDSCSRRLEEYTKSNLVFIGGIGLGLCCIQIFGIIFSCCLVRKIKDNMIKHHY
ncbi:CD151 antigen-like [Argopecten irradians]|uniref:CD151 antigen-like n=1 Tax=Argopecten irradians TaxID=31199 RepID=UPI0037217A4E